MPAVSTYRATGDAYIDGVLGDLKWASADLTFSFPAAASFYGAGYGNGETTNNFAPLNGAQEAAARSALSAYAAIANLDFQEISGTSTQEATLRFAMSDEPGTAWAYFPTTASEGGDIWFNRSSGYYSAPAKGNYANATFLHEIGMPWGWNTPTSIS